MVEAILSSYARGNPFSARMFMSLYRKLLIFFRSQSPHSSHAKRKNLGRDKFDETFDTAPVVL